MYDKLKAVLLIVMFVALGFFAWDYSKTIQQNKELSKDNKTLNQQLKDINDARKTDKINADRVYSISKEHDETLAALTAENQRLQRCIAAGTCGLRVNVLPSPIRVSGDPQSAVSSNAGTAELDSVARQDYYALRQGIIDTQTALKACQQYAGVVLGLNSTK